MMFTECNGDTYMYIETWNFACGLAVYSVPRVCDVGIRV